MNKNYLRCLKYTNSLNENIYKFLHFKFLKLNRIAKSKKINCFITENEFIDQYLLQDGLCFYTDQEMIVQTFIGKTNNTMSIDKIIPSIGYTKENTVFCTSQINFIKNDLSLEEIKSYMPGFYSRIEKHFLRFKI